MNGAEYIVEFLEKKNVEVIFGYPGGQVLFLYDVLGRSSLRHILTRHEQGAVHAADGYARVTGKPGVCFATSGPGATNLVTGLANAYLDSIPLIAITGQVGLASIGRDSFQEADIMGVTMPITKHNYLIKELDQLPMILEEAWHVATTGRPGPVLLDIPRDICMGEMDFHSLNKSFATRKRPQKNGLEEQITKVIEALSKSRKPLLFAGGGVILGHGEELLRELVNYTGIPIISSLLGKGAVPETREGVLGFVGMHGRPAANLAISSCDLLLALGVRFSDRVTGRPEGFLPKAKIVHVDIDAAEISKNIAADIPMVCDVRKFLSELLRRIKEEKISLDLSEWLQEVKELQAKYPLGYIKDNTLKPQQIIEEVSHQAGEKVVVVTDVGQHQMFTAQYYPIGGQRNFVTSGGLGTMGFGLPAAMGAAFGRPGEKVILFTGDGSIQMTSQEFATISEHKLNIKVFILDNACLGMVRQWQELFYKEHYAHSIFKCNPDFVLLAQAYGVKALRINNPGEAEGKIKEALEYNGPVVIHCNVDPGENVLPIVPPGGKPHEMLGRWHGETHISRIS